MERDQELSERLAPKRFGGSAEVPACSPDILVACWFMAVLLPSSGANGPFVYALSDRPRFLRDSHSP